MLTKPAAIVAATMLLGGCATGLDHQLRTNDQLYEVSWSSNPSPIPVNDFFTLEVEVRSDGELLTEGELTVDAAMPHHNHGMNHVPLIERTGPGRWYVEDMLFHMPGYWELYFDVQDQGVTHRAQEPLEVD